MFKRYFAKADDSKEDDKKKAEGERKATKTMEDLGAAIVDLRTEKDQLNEWESISWDPDDFDKNGKRIAQNGPVAMLASLTKITRGLENVLTPEAMDWFSWQVSQLQDAIERKDLEMVEFYNVRMNKYFALLAPLMPKKDKTDIVAMPYVSRPGQQIEDQKLVR